MNRRLFIQSTSLAAAALVVPQMANAAAGMVGKVSVEELEKATKAGGAKVQALEATPAPLSKADEKLMLEVAAGGMMQLQASEVALKKATSPDVKALAKAEVEEQTVLSAKLKEVANVKGVTLPKELPEKEQKQVAKLEAMEGAEFDKAYLKQSGVAGHKMLQKTMTQVEAKAQDPTLKALAATTLPVIKMHLEAAEGELSEA